MATSRPLIGLLALAAALTGPACAGGDSGTSTTSASSSTSAARSTTEPGLAPDAPPVDVLAPSTTTAPEDQGAATTTTTQPVDTTEPIEDETEPAWWTPTPEDLTADDPARVALAWGCAIQTHRAGDSLATWIARVQAVTAPAAVEKLHWIGLPPVLTETAPLQAQQMDPDKSTWRVACHRGTVQPAGDGTTATTIVPVGTVTPILVQLAEDDGRWTVVDFETPAVPFGPIGERGYR